MEKVSQLIGSFSPPEKLQLPNKLDEKKLLLPIVSIATVTTLLYASYKLVIRRENNNKKKGDIKEIPVPGSAYPYVGHMFSLGELPGRTVSEWHKQFGPIIRLHMGVQTWIMVDDPNLAHKIFVTRGIESSYRPESVYGYYHYSIKGKGLSFNQPGPNWKNNRSAALSVLAPKQIDSKYMDSIVREAAHLVDELIVSTEKHGETNPFKYLELNSANVIAMAGFSKTFDSVESPDFIAWVELVEDSLKLTGLENDLANLLPLLSFIDYFAGTQVKMKQFIKERRDPMLRDLINHARRSDKPNLVKSMVEDGFNLSEEDQIVFFSDIVGGGTDSVSITLAWNIAIMCHHPEVQRTAAAEIDKFIEVNGRLPHFSERLELPYCISVIKECMRLRPTTPFGLPHSCKTEFEVDGYVIPANSVIVCNMDSMHKNAELYSDAERFCPERFLSNTKTMLAAANGKIEERDHFNFGWGRRICPAIYLAEVELFCAFGHILAKCSIEPAEYGLPDIVGAKNGGAILAPLPYKVRFMKRQDSLL